MSYADLHVHTAYSDGTFTPAQLVEEGIRAGLSAVAVVDHDTVAGVPLVLEAARQTSLEIIPGIELSAEYEGIEIHILGYLLDYRNSILQEKLEYLKKNRVERIYKILDNLKKMGVALNPESVFAIAGGGTVGRLHIARALVQEKIVSSIFEAFQRYIGDRSPAYVLGFKFSPRQAIQVIKDAGGIPVLAHPYSLRNDDLIPTLIDAGLMGLEVYYPEHSQSMTNYYADIARKRFILLTGGSDCHGAAKPGVKIGAVKVPYELVENLKKAQKNL